MAAACVAVPDGRADTAGHGIRQATAFFVVYASATIFQWSRVPGQLYKKGAVSFAIHATALCVMCA